MEFYENSIYPFYSTLKNLQEFGGIVVAQTTCRRGIIQGLFIIIFEKIAADVLHKHLSIKNMPQMKKLLQNCDLLSKISWNYAKLNFIEILYFKENKS